MADLYCAVREPGCRGKAIKVCHHCGRPICSRCGKVMADHQFARPAWYKRHPKAYHCSDCYHPFWLMNLFKKITMLRMRKFVRQFLV